MCSLKAAIVATANERCEGEEKRWAEFAKQSKLLTKPS